jgi:hypothetical protein
MSTVEVVILVAIVGYGLWRLRHVLERMSR